MTVRDELFREIALLKKKGYFPLGWSKLASRLEYLVTEADEEGETWKEVSLLSLKDMTNYMRCVHDLSDLSTTVTVEMTFRVQSKEGPFFALDFRGNGEIIFVTLPQ